MNNRQICLYDKQRANLDLLRYAEIAKCNIIEDYEYINENNDGGTFTGHAIGTLLGGPIGGIIGGILTSSKHQTRVVKQIGLNLLCKNSNQVTYRLIFMGTR